MKWVLRGKKKKYTLKKIFSKNLPSKHINFYLKAPQLGHRIIMNRKTKMQKEISINNFRNKKLISLKNTHKNLI
jgi:hypothetical protein